MQNHQKGLTGQFSKLSIQESAEDAKQERLQKTLKQWKLAHEEARDMVRQRENEIQNLRQRLHQSEHERTQVVEEMQQLRQIVQAQSTERDITSNESGQQIQVLRRQLQTVQAQLQLERKEKEEAQDKLALLNDVMKNNGVPTSRAGLGDHVHGAPAGGYENGNYGNAQPAPAAAYSQTYPRRGRIVCDEAGNAYDEPDESIPSI